MSELTRLLLECYDSGVVVDFPEEFFEVAKEAARVLEDRREKSVVVDLSMLELALFKLDQALREPC